MLPIRTPSAKVASIGVTRTQLYVEEQLEWIFREQPTEDYGIDAHVEVEDGREVSGRLLALQIKSGASWFSEPTDGGWWYRPEQAHANYWLSHSLPVIVVLYDPRTKVCHWQAVTRKSLERVKTGGWRLLIPEDQKLDGDAREAWLTTADGDPYDLRLRELRLALPWMQLLADGTRLVVDFEEWVNKSSGRGSISVGIDHEDGEDPQELVRWQLLLGSASYAEVVPKFFAWADVDLHEETYDEERHDVYAAVCGHWEEDGLEFTMPRPDWEEQRSHEAIRPYKNGAGEVDYFRVELSLNTLGKSFMVVDKFAITGRRQLTLKGV